MRANREIYVLLTGRISIADCSSRSVVVLISYDLGKLPDEGLYRVTAILKRKKSKKNYYRVIFLPLLSFNALDLCDDSRFSLNPTFDGERFQARASVRSGGQVLYGIPLFV